jgi:DNA-binding transcriptional regulator YhcF (GntR family)
MPLRIAKNSELSVHQQLRQQIIFQITTGELPIGQVMPSMAQLKRTLGVHKNTIDKVYDELTAQRWLYQQNNRRHLVVYPKVPSPAYIGDSVESLIDRLLLAAQAQDMTLEQVAAQLKARAAAEPPDHFLVVEPEPGIGAVLRYEVHKATGRRVVSYSIPELISHPELLARAAVLVPAYLADLLDFVPVSQRATLTVLVYSPFGGYIEGVRKLAKPSIIGMVSVSGPGMKTMEGVFAEAISSRHRLIPFFVAWPPKNPGQPVVKKLTCRQLPPDIDVRRVGLDSLASGNGAGKRSSSSRSWHAELPLATKEDLRAVDVLFCDSITSSYVQHPKCFTYRLLSDESLQKIAAVSLATS